MATKKPAKKSVKKAQAQAKPAPRRPAAKPGAAKPKAASPVRATPETLRLRTASPSLTVNDVEKSLAWYRDVLGCVAEERWEKDGQLLGAMVLAGDVSFMLGQDDWKKGRDRKKGEGFRIYCTTAQDVDVLANGIRKRGWKLDQEPKDQPWGTRDFSLTDPDGYKLTIAAEPKR